MKKEDKELLLKDLSARLYYKPTVLLSGREHCILCGIDGDEVYLDVDSDPFSVESIKPYLRPLSSMTEEEKEEYINIKQGECNGCVLTGKGDPNTEFLLVDFFNSHHLDYRKSYDLDRKEWLSMIEKGLAIEAPAGMYETQA